MKTNASSEKPFKSAKVRLQEKTTKTLVVKKRMTLK